MGRRKKGGRRSKTKSVWNRRLKAQREQSSRAVEEGGNPFNTRARVKGTVSSSGDKDWF